MHPQPLEELAGLGGAALLLAAAHHQQPALRRLRPALEHRLDVFRRLEPGPDHYTWWSNRGQAWANNVGWRLDYQIATPGIAATATAVSIYKTRRFSDHAPLTIDYDYGL